ncbi:histidine phosphatase family protein [Candidatus Woesearchaeota archaeon]|nr:histidine phosphatase family protein [Candidatus Woesearchaeota archaeon]
MILIITRHGETEENKAGIIQGHLPGKLSEEGVQQAQKVALQLRMEKVDYIYSSDLARAADTAREIARFHPQAILVFTKELRERNLGEFQGKKKTDFGWGARDFKATALDPQEGETLEQLYHRAENFLQHIISKHRADTVLFVGHNGINKALLAVITGKTAEGIQEIENQRNADVIIFNLDQDKNNTIRILSAVKH